MQFSTLLVAFTSVLAAGVIAHPAGQCKPPTKPTDPNPTCTGNKVCCSQGLQGNVGYYCWEGPLQDGQTCPTITVCCDKDATKDLTPRGYTWTGCHAMPEEPKPEEPKPEEPKPEEPKPEEPKPEEPKPTCDGNKVCCSKGLQGNVGYYCGDNALSEGQACDMITVCCDKDATKDLTPRGYTWTGCHAMPEEPKPEEPKPEEPKPTCDGNKVCCSKGLQGNVGYYCGDNALSEGQACDMVTVCCDKDATKDLTPRGYTWTGCHSM